MVFDRVIAIRLSLEEAGQGRGGQRSFRSISLRHTSKDAGDLAFIQHMIASLNAEGKDGVVVPHGVLFRGSSEKKSKAF